MDEHINTTAKVLEQGGATVAVGSWFAAGITYLDNHSAGILALCGICGLVISIAGFFLGWLYKHLEYKRGEADK